MIKTLISTRVFLVYNMCSWLKVVFLNGMIYINTCIKKAKQTNSTPDLLNSHI